MMSPKSLTFIQHLKKESNINFGNQTQNNKLGMTMNGFGRTNGFNNDHNFGDL